MEEFCEFFLDAWCAVRFVRAARVVLVLVTVLALATVEIGRRDLPCGCSVGLGFEPFDLAG